MTTRNPNYGKPPAPHTDPAPAPLSGSAADQVQREADYRRRHAQTMTANGVSPQAANANMPKG
jgi:hypothetical protein